jgi:glyoxylase I family protein
MAIKNVSGLAPLFQVFDCAKSLAWYRDVLGFEVVSTHEPEGHLSWAMLRLGNATLMLNAKYEVHKTPAVPESVTGRNDVTLYFACDNVDEAYLDLRARGCSVEEPSTAYYGMRQMHVVDPDGFSLCFQHPVGSK